MNEQEKQSKIIVWGGKNEQKSRRPVRWNHDYILYASHEDQLSVLDDPTVLLPHVFDINIEDIASRELYDGVFEYKSEEMTVEMVEGFDYSIYKIFGKNVDFDAIIKRLSVAGIKYKKPEIAIDIPDRPPLLDEEKIFQKRYEYNTENLEKDRKYALSETIKSVIKNTFTILFVGILLVFAYMEIFIPKIKDVTPPPQDFITAKGNYIVYSFEGRMVLFKIAEDVEDIGYDSTWSIYIPEAMDLSRKVVVERLVDPLGNVVYERGNQVIDFESNPTDYGFVNATPFLFDTYGNGGPVDWKPSGSLADGNAQKIILRGRVLIQEGRYLFILGRTYAKLGDVSDTVPFFELMEDDISRAAVLYSLKEIKDIHIYGQIQKTLTSYEGRNTLEKIIFTFKVFYARPR